MPRSIDPDDGSMFGYFRANPDRALRREVLKWVQGLDLSHSVRDVRRDIANGYVVAEICSRYFPSELALHSFETGSSTAFRKHNWAMLTKFFLRVMPRAALNPKLVDGVIKEYHGCAIDMMENLYTVFTLKELTPQAAFMDPASYDPSISKAAYARIAHEMKTKDDGSAAHEVFGSHDLRNRQTNPYGHTPDHLNMETDASGCAPSRRGKLVAGGQGHMRLDDEGNPDVMPDDASLAGRRREAPVVVFNEQSMGNSVKFGSVEREGEIESAMEVRQRIARASGGTHYGMDDEFGFY